MADPNDIFAYNIDEGPPRHAARINFFRRLEEQQTGKPVDEPEPSPAPAAPPIPPKPAAGTEPEPKATAAPKVHRHRAPILIITAMVGIAVLGAGAYLFTQSPDQPPVAVDAPSTPAPKGTPKLLPQVGTTPPPASTAPIPVPETPLDRPAESGATYVVVRADSLTAIGDRLKKDWRAIYEANRDRIGPDPNLIYAGTILVIP